MKKLFIVFLLTSTFTFAQQTQINNLQDVYTLKNDIEDKYNPYDSSIKGSAFIHSTFQNITLKGNQMKGKYNANRDYMELEKKGGETVFFLPTIEYKYKVVFTDLNVTYLAFEYEKFKYGFFKILKTNDKAFLLAKEFIKLKPAKKPKSNFDVFKPAKFERKNDTYFIKFNDNDLVVELPTSKGKFIKVFKDKGSSIKKYLKKERLNIKKEKDLIKIFNYYNSL